MWKSSEICDKNPKYDFKIFFQACLPDLVFLVVCSIHKRNSWLNRYRMLLYFFYKNNLNILFKKMAKKSSSNLSHLAHKRSIKSFKKKLKLERNGFKNEKNVNFLRSYKDLKLNVENAKNAKKIFKTIFRLFSQISLDLLSTELSGFLALSRIVTFHLSPDDIRTMTKETIAIKFSRPIIP